MFFTLVSVCVEPDTVAAQLLVAPKHTCDTRKGGCSEFGAVVATLCVGTRIAALTHTHTHTRVRYTITLYVFGLYIYAHSNSDSE